MVRVDVIVKVVVRVRAGTRGKDSRSRVTLALVLIRWYSYSPARVLAHTVLVVMVVIGVVLRVRLDVVVMGGTYTMLVTLETSQLPMSWSNDEAS